MAYGYHLEATYQDGYVHNEAYFEDASPYEDNKNIFYDILNRKPEAEHGPMITFSIVSDVPMETGLCQKFDIDWRPFPKNAKPIYFRKMQRDMDLTTGHDSGPYALEHYFGFEYKKPFGKKVKELMRLN